MAKSLRSKWRRKMKNVKRERYGKKELDQLVTMLQNAGELPLPEGEVKMELPAIPSHTNPIFHKEQGIPYIPPVHTREPRIKFRPVRGAARKSRRDEGKDSEASESEEDDEEEKEMKSEGQDRNEKIKEEAMAVDKPEHIFSKRTMKDQFGNYPAWMNKRKMQTQQKKNKRIARNRANSAMGKRTVSRIHQ